MNFLIAYNNIDGNGFRNNYPWLQEASDNIEIAKNDVKMLIELGMKNVTLFYMHKGEYIEQIPWSFINKRKIEI